MTNVKKLYLVVRTELPMELPVEIIRGFTSEEQAVEFFINLTGASIDVIADVIDGEEWVINKRLLDDECFYGIIQTELDES